MTKTSKAGSSKTPTAKPADIKTNGKTTEAKVSPVASSHRSASSVKAPPVAATETKAPAIKPMAEKVAKPTPAAAPETKTEAQISRPVEPDEKSSKTPITVPQEDTKVTLKPSLNEAQPVDSLIGYKEVVAFYGDALDAVVTSASALNDGYREMSRVLLALATSSLDEGFETSQSLFDCKDMGEVAKRQISLLQGSYENAIAGGQKLADISLTVSERAMTPFTEPIDAAVKAWVSPLT